jgi:hypothetical protein
MNDYVPSRLDPSLNCTKGSVWCRVRSDGAGGKAAFGDKEILQMVVATEVFELFGETGQKLRAIAIAVAQRWEGVEQAATGILITYLERNIPSATSFLASLSFQPFPTNPTIKKVATR